MLHDNRALTETYGERGTLVRPPVGNYDSDGNFVDGSPTRLRLRLASAPLRSFETKLVDGNIRKIDEAGGRLERSRKFYVPVSARIRTVYPIRARTNKSRPDSIEYKGDEYVVLSVINYDEEGFCEVLAVVQDA